jgi:hypothetical protein
MAAAGLWTTPSDLARVVLAVQRAYTREADAFLPADLAEELLTPQASNVAMGLGLLVEGDGSTLRFRHGGDDQGFVAGLEGYAALGPGVVVMTNSDAGQWVIEPLLAALARAYAWPERAGADEPETRSATQAEVDACAGTYEAEDGYRFGLIAVAGGLALVVPEQGPIPLAAASPTEWHALALAASVYVELDSDGRAVRARLHQNAQYVEDVAAVRVI